MLYSWNGAQKILKIVTTFLNEKIEFAFLHIFFGINLGPGFQLMSDFQKLHKIGPAFIDEVVIIIIYHRLLGINPFAAFFSLPDQFLAFKPALSVDEPP